MPETARSTESGRMRDYEQSCNRAKEVHYKPDRRLIQRKIALLSVIRICQLYATIYRFLSSEMVIWAKYSSN